MRLALGISYCGSAYQGWQSQASGQTVQDHLQAALAAFTATPAVSTLCAGRTDAGVHALQQVVHFDTAIERPLHAWVRGCNRYLPPDIAIQWAQPVPAAFHARASALARRYVYVLLESPVRPSLEHGRAGWVFRPLALPALQAAAAHLLGRHDFTSFRASSCQALSPVKHLRRLDIARHGAYWRFEFEADAFLHHMVRNLMGCLLAVGQGLHPPEWIAAVLAARSRAVAAPTFAPDGLYFVGPVYAPHWGLPSQVPGLDWLPSASP
ncbi:MAG: tRNA pseudouridine(38-40) synthase TruA [Serpentinimonas sp.]|nr:tRNA pseudouridine(38-40) synthase TruA [Serpentinimonas sp.]